MNKEKILAKIQSAIDDIKYHKSHPNYWDGLEYVEEKLAELIKEISEL
jgi:hypothetical protein